MGIMVGTRRRSARWVRWAVAAAAAGSTVAAPAACRPVPAGAAEGAPVDCSAGVIVAVDLAPWGGAVRTVCVDPPSSTAADALQDAGFDPTPVATYGLAFVCQIAGDPQGEDCSTTPPADAYWALWYAPAGQGSWTYSEVGAMGLEPQAGSVEAWVFGDDSGGAQPAVPSPDQIRAATTVAVAGPAPTTTTAPAPTSPAPSAPAPSAASGPGPSAAPTTSTSTSSVPSAGRSGSAGGTSSGGTGGGQHGAGGGTGTSSGGSTAPSRQAGKQDGGRPGLTIVSGAPTAAARPATGSPVGLLVGLCVAAALLAVAVLAVRGRRRARAGPP